MVKWIAFRGIVLSLVRFGIMLLHFTDYKSQGETIEYVIIEESYRLERCDALTKQRQGHHKAAQRFRPQSVPASSIGSEIGHEEAGAIERSN